MSTMVGAPWLAYAWVMADRNRQHRPDTDFSSGVDHYSVQAALALALFALAVLAAGWTRGQRQVGTYAAVCSIYVGALSLGWPAYPGSVEKGWAIASVLWGVALGLWAWLARPMTSSTTSTPPAPISCVAEPSDTAASKTAPIRGPQGLRCSWAGWA